MLHMEEEGGGGSSDVHVKTTISTIIKNISFAIFPSFIFLCSV